MSINEKEFQNMLLKEPDQRYFDSFCPGTKLSINQRKRENCSLITKRNTKEIITKHKGTRMVKDGELRLTRITNDELEKLGLNFF